MKNKLFLLTSAFVAMIALVGCQPTETPLPTPEKVVVSGVSFTQFADTNKTTGIYQLDGEGAYYTTNGDVQVSYTPDVYTMTISGNTYLNDKYWTVGLAKIADVPVGGRSAVAGDAPSHNYFTDADGNTQWFAIEGGKLGYHLLTSVTNMIFWTAYYNEFSNWTDFSGWTFHN